MKHKINDSAENIERVINSYIVGYKAHRNRQILKSKYIDGYTFEEVAEMYDLSDRHVKELCYKFLPIIIEHLRVEE